MKIFDVDEICTEICAEITKGNPEWAQTLRSFDTKNVVLQLAKLVSNLEAEEAEQNEVLTTLQNKIRGTKELRDTVKAFVEDTMEATGFRKFEDSEIKVSLHLGPPAVTVDNLNNLPENFKKAKMEDIPITLVPDDLFTFIQEIRPDKNKIKLLYGDGGTLPECVTITQKKYLKIK